MCGCRYLADMGKLQSKFRKRSDIYRASQGEKAENTFDSQVVQYEPAHQGSTNTVTNLSPDLCVSGGSDQVHSCNLPLESFR
ncbi:WD repeat-containing protein 31-like [Etheostoma cragini]|uniref:WD repeat-containing protein 31-like n=1 Tax=Etheostoma cragini TaxID=417921 RepID=UPI00155E43C0|nr:WD repeat-containing protein 31-like [Etheostoma cragini]